VGPQAPIGAQPEFFGFMGSDSGFLSLVASPHVKNIADFSGKTLSVDALTTGYAFVLYDIILRRNGLDRSAYQIRRVGGMVQRFNSLVECNEDGTLLSAPYNLIAKTHGLTELVKATTVLGDYLGNIAAARRSWAKDNGWKIVAFIRGYAEAITWLYEPGHRDEAIAILLRNLPQMPQTVAEASYSELLDPKDGVFRDCSIDLEGMACVLDLRSRYGNPRRQLNDPKKYCELSYYERVIS